MYVSVCNDYVTSLREPCHSLLCMFHCIERSLCDSKSAQVFWLINSVQLTDDNVTNCMCSLADEHSYIVVVSDLF